MRRGPAIGGTAGGQGFEIRILINDDPLAWVGRRVKLNIGPRRPGEEDRIVETVIEKIPQRMEGEFSKTSFWCRVDGQPLKCLWSRIVQVIAQEG